MPFLLLSGLALGGGGLDLFARHLTGVLAWILVAVLLLARFPERPRPGLRVAVIGGLILALALFSAISSLWSSSISASLAEFERCVGYLGLFLAAYLTMRTPKQREWFAFGVAAGLGVIVLLAIGDRLSPGGKPGDDFGVDRLSFPLGYWNAIGICSGAAIALSVWFACNTDHRWKRSGAVAMATLATVTLFMTYSRGGLLVCLITLLALLCLSRKRVRILATSVTAIAAAIPVLVVIDGYPEIAGDGAGNPDGGESLAVAAVILGGLALSALLLEALVRLAHRYPRARGRVLAVSRDRRNLFALGAAGLGAVLLLVLFFGNTAWEQFTDSDAQFTPVGKERLTDLSSAYRYEFSQAALETFREDPLHGSGAGTFPFQWNQLRDVMVFSRAAHSFYLESLSDLGVFGGVLSLGTALALLWFGFVAWRRRQGRDAAMILALTLALLIAFGFDWFWHLGTTAALLMLLAAWIASAETVDPARADVRAGPGWRVGGLLAAWASVVVLVVPMLADHYGRASEESVEAGRIERAIDQANQALRFNPWSARAHMQLGTIAVSREQFSRALAEFDRAIELEPENWQAWILRYRANRLADRLDAARRDYARLQELNPVYFEKIPFRD